VNKGSEARASRHVRCTIVVQFTGVVQLRRSNPSGHVVLTSIPCCIETRIVAIVDVTRSTWNQPIVATDVTSRDVISCGNSIHFRLRSTNLLT